MNSSFIIQEPNIFTESATLFIQVKRLGFSYIIMENNTCLGLANFHFKNGTSDELTASAVYELVAANPVLEQKFQKTHIIYNYTPSVLVPNEYMSGNENRAMLELVYGDQRDAVIRNDYLYRHLIHNIYSIPSPVDAVMTRYFSWATCSHLFSLLPDIMPSEGSHLYCIFDTEQLTVQLQKDGKLQLTQHFSFKTPEDVVYHLLNVCTSFEVNMKEVSVHLTGMIDIDSALYKELYKYFLNLVFEGLPEVFQYPQQINDHPAHYFSHLFATAACV